MRNLTLLFILSIFLMPSCQSSKKEGKKVSNLPEAYSQPGQIILVIDPAQWSSALGETLKNIYRAPVEGLLRNEPSFTLSVVTPEKLTALLKNAKNMIFVSTLDNDSPSGKWLRNYISPSSIKKIKENPKLFMYAKQNEFANGQNILHLFGDTEKSLIENLEKNASVIFDHFYNIEIEAYQKNIKRSNETEKLLQKAGFNIKIPKSFENAHTTKDFFWYREIGDAVDKSLYITFKKYGSESIFNRDSLISWRNQIGQKYLFDDPEKKGSYVVTEDITVVNKEVSFSGRYAVEMRGMWKTNNYSVGGPFISYALVDEDRNRIYYIEGFAIAPTKEKRDILRYLEAILKTFSPTQQGS